MIAKTKKSKTVEQQASPALSKFAFAQLVIQLRKAQWASRSEWRRWSRANRLGRPIARPDMTELTRLEKRVDYAIYDILREAEEGG
jgi:hypothetical protein